MLKVSRAKIRVAFGDEPDDLSVVQNRRDEMTNVWLSHDRAITPNRGANLQK